MIERTGTTHTAFDLVPKTCTPERVFRLYHFLPFQLRMLTSPSHFFLLPLPRRADLVEATEARGCHIPTGRIGHRIRL